MDEADRLLDMGFKRDLDSIMSFLPQGQSFTHPRSTLTTCPLIPPCRPPPHDPSSHTPHIYLSCFAARSVIHTSSLNPHDIPSHPPHYVSSHVLSYYLLCRKVSHSHILAQPSRHALSSPRVVLLLMTRPLIPLTYTSHALPLGRPVSSSHAGGPKRPGT